MLSTHYRMLLVLAIKFSILLAISADSVNWHDAGSLYEVQDVRVSSCDLKSCVVARGEEYIIEIDFVATSSAKNLFFKITASKFGITIPLLEGNLCDEGNKDGKIVVGTCPVKEGDKISYKYSAKVPHSLPAISGTVNGRVFEDDRDLIKLSVDIQISTASSSPSSKFDLFGGFSFFKHFRFSREEQEPNY